MKKLLKTILSISACACLAFPCFGGQTVSANTQTKATNYTAAEDVEYKKSGNYLLNWGARGETCVFLSPNAKTFYSEQQSYSVLSKTSGGSSTSDAHKSELYSALQSLMKDRHTKITNYDETRYLFQYTDCQLNDHSVISSFYSGVELSGTWDSGKTWNREHVWPNSKGLNGSDENDLMMLRPTAKSENGARSNKAFGTVSPYYVPSDTAKGDCARIVLYVYVRWGNTALWGESGVIESLPVLLDWMKTDPVDTWEMGRNDAVQAITGTRNVFVDYPEYAWLLFGENVPNDAVTPSGEAKNEVCRHEYGEWSTVREATETVDGKRMRACYRCGATQTELLPKTGVPKKNIAPLVACIVMAIVVAAGALIVVIGIRKKKK
ncbi:MAG: endonuclease [Clostridia bacterium]|nr:endonuclease [Clostridia bacterium]